MKKIYALLVLFVAFSLVGIKQVLNLDNSNYIDNLIHAQICGEENNLNLNTTKIVEGEETLSDIDIVINDGCSLDSAIKVAEGAVLTLQNVNFINNGSINNCYIYNCGKVIIDNVTFDNTSNAYDIINDSSEFGCVTLLNVAEEENIHINLKQNSVYVNENSQIDGNITLSLYQMNYDDLNDNYIGKVLVKGDNTFAGMYIDHFKFLDAPDEEKLKDNKNDKYFENFVDKYYIDYAGVLGDSIDVANDGIEVSYGKNLEYTNFIDSGDIILTKFSIKLKISGIASDAFSFFIEEVDDENAYLYIGGKYATSRIFVQALLDRQLSNCVVGGGVGDVNSNKGYTTGYFALDNVHALINKNDNAYVYLGAASFQKFDINISVNDVTETEYFYASVAGEISSCAYTSSYLLPIFLNGNSLQKDIIASNNISQNCIVKNDIFHLLQLEISDNLTNQSIGVFLQSASSNEIITTYISSTSEVYSKVDFLTDDNYTFVPYYMDGENKQYLESAELKVYKLIDGIENECIQIKDVGEYVIYIESKSDMVYAVTEYRVNVTARYLDITFGKTNFEYDGSEHVLSASIGNVCEGDEILLEIPNNQNKYPGNYTLEITIDQSSRSAQNYMLKDEDKTRNITIDKGTLTKEQIQLDTILVDGVETKMVVYNGQAQTIQMLNTIEGVSISCQSYINAGNYSVSVDFVINTNLFKSAPSISVNLIIAKQKLSIDEVQLADITHTYNGEKVKVTVPTDILNTLDERLDRRVVITGDNVSEAKETPYEVQVQFFVKDIYAKNYELDDSIKIVKIYIKQAEFDLSLLQFNSDTIVFDGEWHTLSFKNDYKEIVIAKLNTNDVRDCGNHSFTLELNQVDNINYKTLPDKITAILTITQKTLVTSSIKFEDKTLTYDKDSTFKMNVVGAEELGLDVTYTYYLNDETIDFENVGKTGAGEYRVVATFSSLDITNGNIAKVKDKEAYLIVNKKEIDFSLIVFKNDNFIYDKNMHMLTKVTSPYNIDFTYSTTGEKEVGTYIVYAYPNINEQNYIAKNRREILATMVIAKAKYDMSGIEFKNYSVTYDGTLKSVTIKGKLPDGVTCTYENNAYTNAGTYVAIAHFVGDEENFETIADMKCILEIKQKKVEVKLEQDTFVYTGESVDLNVLILSGVLDGDSCTATSLNSSQVNYGTYSAMIQLDNENYIPAKSSLTFYIKKADLDLSKMLFEDVMVTYDGQEHAPQLVGRIPNGIVPNFVMGSMVNVGEYVVYVDFTVANNNYNKPDRLTAKVTINKKPILVEFSGYTGLIEDGNRKDINVKFIGVVDKNFDGYKKIYSSEPISAGKYTLNIQLNDNSNYEILGVTSQDFEILTNTKSYKDGTFQVQILGEGFSENSEVNIVQTTNKLAENLQNEGMNIKNYQAFKIEMSNIDGVKNINVTLKTTSINLSKDKNIKLFKVLDGNLREVECKVYNNQLVFDANVGDEIIIVEENADSNIWLILGCVFSGIVLLALVSTIIILAKRKKRKCSNGNYFIEEK